LPEWSTCLLGGRRAARVPQRKLRVWPHRHRSHLDTVTLHWSWKNHQIELRHGAERLADPDDGDLAGYLRDTNWPGATSCAMSPETQSAFLRLGMLTMVEGVTGMGSGHMRGLIRAALHGNEYSTKLHRKIFLIRRF